MTMTTTPETMALRRAAVRGTLAPSVHNTQPWLFTLHDKQLDLFADPTRRLPVLDPSGRQLHISCGCALFNVRAAIAAAGFTPVVSVLPDDEQQTLLASVTLDTASSASASVTEELASLDHFVEARRSNRRRFSKEPVPDALIDALVDAAESEGARLVPVTREEDRVMVAVLSQRADAEQNSDRNYRSEVRTWTTDDPERGDGVPTSAFPHTDADSHDEIPIRDFDSSGKGELPAETNSSSHQCLLLLGTDEDTPHSWIQAGQALERVMLAITRDGFAVSPLTQMIEVVPIRAQLRQDLRLDMHPHVLLRVGRAPETPAPRRRRLIEMLTQSN